MLVRRAVGILILVGAAGCSSGNGGGPPVPDAGGLPDSGLQVLPTVTGVTPSSGPTDGGTTVTITGTGFASGASVHFGGVPAASVNVSSSTQISTVTPPNAAGAVSVEVINPNSRFGSLASGFTYTASTPVNTGIGWCDLQFPTNTTGAAGSPLTLYGQVYVMGLTDSSGTAAAPGIVMQAAIGSVDAGLTWNSTTFNVPVMNNDEYQWITTYPAEIGTYQTLFRAQLNGGPWYYCETDGGFGPTVDVAELGQVEVTPPTSDLVDWCDLQFPTSLTTNPAVPITFYGQVYKAGLTTATGAAPGIVMQAGIAPVDGGWTWNPTTFNVNVGNNDEFQWVTTAPPVGDYLTAFRASLDGGPWSYCETDGVHPQIIPSTAGTLDVVTAPTQIGWCNLQFPTQASGTPNAPLALYSRVYVQGVTDQPAQQGPGISVQIAVGNPDGGLAFVYGNATFDANTDNGANDEFEVQTTYPASVGTYVSLARAQINGGAWSYCEVDGPHTSPDPAEYGSVTVVPPSPLLVDWCNLQFPTAETTNPGTAITFYGEVYKAGITDSAGQGAGIAMQAGISSDAGGLSWVDATYDVDVGNNDEYQWVTSAPAVGQYATAFRASLDGGPWTYCEVNGPSSSFVLQQAGSLTVVPVAAQVVNWCNLQFPLTATGAPGAPFTLYGQVYQPGVSPGVGQGAGIVMQAGLGWLDGGWGWTAATYQSDQGNNDQYQWQTTDPTTVGTYGTAFRASLDGGPWSYCEVDGLHSTFDLAEVGSLTVEVAPAPMVGWCNLQYPLSITTMPDSALTLYGEVYVAGSTNAAGQAPGITMQAGVSEIDGGWSWLPAVYNSNQGNNDEYQATITTPASSGTYLTAFRAALDGGPWSYCEVDGLNGTLDPTDAGTLTVATSSAVGAVQWCNLQFPQQETSNPGDSVTFYGRVYEPGLTDQAGNTGAGVYLEFGLSASTDGVWTWSPAAFGSNVAGLNPNVLSNDEFQYVETAPAVGNYATAYRAALDGGPWSYCEDDGIHATLDTSETGQFTVVAPAPAPTVEWCNLQYPTQASGTPGQALTLYGQVYQPGLTTQSGQAPGIVMQAGLSPVDGGWTWNPTVFNVNVGNNDEFMWQTTDPDAGSYLTAFRASLDGGPWVYCETDGEHATLNVAECGTLSVQ